MQMSKTLALLALFGSFVFQLQGCGGGDEEGEIVSTAAPATTAAPGGGDSVGDANATSRRLEFDFTFTEAEDVHV